MAFSSAFKTDSIEQTTTVCHLCEIEANLKWKCRECNLLMCQRCKDKVHPKFPSAIYHDVVDIKDIGKDEDDQVAELIFTNLKCKLHKSQICRLFCNTCHEIVCPTCFTKQHKAHDLIEVKEGYNKIVDKLKDVDKTIDQQFDTSSINEEKLNVAKFVGQINNARATKEIVSQAEELLKAVETYKDKLLTDLRQKSNSLFLSLEGERKQTKRTRERLMEQKKKVNEVNEVIQSKDIPRVFAASKVLENIAIPKAAVKDNFVRLPTVIRGQIKNISKVFGSIQENDLKPNFKYNLKHLLLMNSDPLLELNNYKMMFLPDGTMLISDQRTILNIDITTDPVSIISEIKARSNCMAVDSSGDILLSNGSSTLNLLCKDTKQILPTGFDVSLMEITAMHVAYNKDILVGGFSDGAPKLIVMHQTAEVKKEYQFDNNIYKKQLFNEVICITSNHRNTIGIADSRRVLIIGQDSNTITVYTGHPAFKVQGVEFKPYDIVSTALDNFVVLDKQNMSLHILNNEGQAIIAFLTNQLIAEYPDALCIGGTSHLYIACHVIENDRKTSVYSVDISGW